MDPFPSDEHRSAFGRLMLTLRDAIGLTQGGLAERLGISRHAVGAWEAGSKYSNAAHLKQFITLALAQQAVPAGREAKEIRALWRAAHQKMLLDEAWLAVLLAPPPLTAPAQPPAQPAPPPPSSAGGRRVDWGEALTVAQFYGREWELDLLTAWVVGERSISSSPSASSCNGGARSSPTWRRSSALSWK